MTSGLFILFKIWLHEQLETLCRRIRVCELLFRTAIDRGDDHSYKRQKANKDALGKEERL